MFPTPGNLVETNKMNVDVDVVKIEASRALTKYCMFLKERPHLGEGMTRPWNSGFSLRKIPASPHLKIFLPIFEFKDSNVSVTNVIFLQYSTIKASQLSKIV